MKGSGSGFIGLLAVFCLAAPAPAQVCGRVDGAASAPTASDALGALNAAVAKPGACRLCLCDVDGNGAVSASDALAILRKAVGLDATFSCVDCACGIPQRFSVGTHPRVVQLADLDGDGVIDIVSADDEAHGLSVLLGQGEGRFAAATTVDPDGDPLAVTIADLDGDDVPDLVTANLEPSAIALLRGRGDGTFFPAQLLSSGDSPIRVAVGDLNGDDRPDLVTANSLSNDVSIHLAGAVSGYVEQPRVAVGTGPRWVELVDVTGDGKLDAVTANRDSHDVTILAGIGDGTFGTAITIPVCAGAHHIAAGRFNADDDIDLLVPCKADRGVAVLISKGGGEFEAPVFHDTHLAAISAAVADIDGDGDLDAAVNHWYGGGPQLFLFEGMGDGTFTESARLGNRTKPRGIALGDVTGEGLVDIVTANTESNDVVVFRGVGRVDLGDLDLQFVTFRPRVRDMVPADFDDDGRTDFVTVNWQAYTTVFTRSSPTSERFGAVELIDDPRFPSDAVAGDFNGDGKMDFVVKNNKVASDLPGKRCTDPHLALFLGKGDLTFQDEVRVAAGNLTHHTDDDFVAADVAGDGIDDLVIIERQAGVVTYMRGRDNGQFEVVQRITADTKAERLAAGDVNADGAPDLAWIEGPEGRSIVVRLRDEYLRYGFSASATLAVDAKPSWLVIGDVNVDGRGDLIYGFPDRTTVEVRLSQADGGFSDPIVSDVGMTFFETPVLVDADVDRAPDLVGLEALGPWDPLMPRGGQPGIATGKADGTFRTAEFILPSDSVPTLAGMSTGALLPANLDDDPSLDLVVAYFQGTHGVGPLLYNVGHCLEPTR
jgi:hypothetical protein